MVFFVTPFTQPLTTSAFEVTLPSQMRQHKIVNELVHSLCFPEGLSHVLAGGPVAVLLGPEGLLLHVEDDLLEGAVLHLLRRLDVRRPVVPRPQHVHQL